MNIIIFGRIDLRICGPTQCVLMKLKNGRGRHWAVQFSCPSLTFCDVSADDTSLKNDRSEGSPNGIFCPCALWARGLARLKNCRRVAAAAIVGVTWKFRSTFWLGNYIWSLSLWNWTQMGHLGTSVPGFCTEFRYLSYRQSGLAWGAFFEKSPKIKNINFLRKWTCPKNPEMSFFRKKRRRRPNAGNTAGSF